MRELESSDRAARRLAWRDVCRLWRDARAELASLSRAVAWEFASTESLEQAAPLASILAPDSRRLRRQRATAVGVEQLRPWDWEAPFGDPDRGAAAAVPITDPIGAALELLTRWSPPLGRQLADSLERGTLAIAPTSGRAEARVDGERTILALPRSRGASSLATAIHEFAHATHFILDPAPPLLLAESFALTIELLALDTVRRDDPACWSHARLDALFRAQERWSEFRAWECFAAQVVATPSPPPIEEQWSDARQQAGVTDDWPLHRFAAVALLCDVPSAATTYRRAQETALEAWWRYRPMAGSTPRVLEACRALLTNPHPTGQTALQPTFERVEEEREMLLSDRGGGTTRPGRRTPGIG